MARDPGPALRPWDPAHPAEASTHLALEPGSTLGPFRIVRLLGRGGMASVFEAHEGALDRKVALKVLHMALLEGPAFADRFRREARVVAQLEHPHIVPIYGYGIDNETPWMSMRLLPGGSLHDHLTGVPMPVARALVVLRQVAAALDFAHRRGVIHRDVKPQNILLDEDGTPYLADFGIARMVESTTALTASGAVLGTPTYMAPEQGSGVTVDHRCDVYSLGVIAYQMLVGEVPFRADTPVAVLLKHIQEPVPVPRLPDLPQAAVDALLKCMAKRREDRWGSAAEFVRALEAGAGRHLTQPGPPAPPPPPPSPAPRPAAPTPVPVRTAPGPEVPSLPPPPRRRRPPVEPTMDDERPAPAVAPPSPAPAAGRIWPWAAGLAALGLLAVGTMAAVLVLRPWQWLGPRPAASAAPTPEPTSGPVAAPVPEPSPEPTAPSSVAPSSPATAPVAAPTTATLSILSKEPGSTLSLDGRPLGAARARLAVPPGTHRVVASKRGCQDAVMDVEAGAGQALEVEVTPVCATTAAVAVVLPSAAPPTPLPPPTTAPAGAPPAGAPASSRVNPVDLQTYVRVAPGTFRMGCARGDAGCDARDELPHDVTLSEGFWIGQTETTLGAYKRFAAAAGRSLPPPPAYDPELSQDRLPVVRVTWADAEAACSWAGGRLPTEAEWEYAARGGKADTLFPWGNDAPSCRQGSPSGAAHGACGERSPWPVGSFAPNGFGLYDIVGNVWEWCSDWYREAYYGVSPGVDPPGPAQGKERVIRGGSWNLSRAYLRLSYRNRAAPTTQDNQQLGFRCVLERMR